MQIVEGHTADTLWRRVVEQLLYNQGVSRQHVRGHWTRELLHVVFELREPRQRWVISRDPPINPGFALAELVWIMTGRDDAAFLDFWNRSYRRFAGDSDRYHGAYGARLRRRLGVDQLERAYSALRQCPDTRQVVLQIWDSALDLPLGNGASQDPDIPCSVCSLLKVRDGKLDWFQIIRSNDVFLGFPYDIVQWTSIQEVLAGWLGLALGGYYQLSDSLHLYERDIGVIGISEVGLVANTDVLAMPREDSERIFGELAHAFENLASKNLRRQDLVQSVGAFSFEIAIQNIVCIVAAEAARRRGWLEEARELGERCKNPALALALKRWQSRRVGTQDKE